VENTAAKRWMVLQARLVRGFVRPDERYIKVKLLARDRAHFRALKCSAV
jgi:hypothetical protein